MRRLLGLLLLAVALAGCGSEDAERLREDVQERAEQVREGAEQVRERTREARRRAERLGDRILARVRETLEQLEQAVPEAGPATRAPSSRDIGGEGPVVASLTEVVASVDTYWTRTLTAAGRPEPRVSYLWVEPGDRVRSACGAVADDRAAFYCPRDDAIYVGQTLAAELIDGVAEGFPGQAAGYGRAVGDFGVAYVVAHEYAHNLQAELGAFAADRGPTVKPLELQADCMAGLWGNSVYREGRFDDEDVQEALSTALAVGDFDAGSEQHHGTPTERRDAWLTGFRGGDPRDCARFSGT